MYVGVSFCQRISSNEPTLYIVNTDWVSVSVYVWNCECFLINWYVWVCNERRLFLCASLKCEHVKTLLPPVLAAALRSVFLSYECIHIICVSQDIVAIIIYFGWVASCRNILLKVAKLGIMLYELFIKNMFQFLSKGQFLHLLIVFDRLSWTS